MRPCAIFFRFSICFFAFFLLLFHTLWYFFFHFHIRDAGFNENDDERARERECVSIERGKETLRARTRDAFGLFTSCERGFNILWNDCFFFLSEGERALTFFFRMFSEPEKCYSQVRARERPSREPSGENAGSDDGVGVLHGFEEEGCE